MQFNREGPIPIRGLLVPERELAALIFQTEQLKETRVRVLVRHARTRLYYAGPGQWVADSALGLDFQSIQRAYEAPCAGPSGGTQIALRYDDPECELILPVEIEWR